MQPNPNWVFFRSNALIEDSCPTAHGLAKALGNVTSNVTQVEDRCSDIVEQLKGMSTAIGAVAAALQAAREEVSTLSVRTSQLERKMDAVHHNTLAVARHLTPREAQEVAVVKFKPPFVR